MGTQALGLAERDRGGAERGELIRSALEDMRHEVTIDPAVAVGARQAVERMLAVP